MIQGLPIGEESVFSGYYNLLLLLIYWSTIVSKLLLVKINLFLQCCDVFCVGIFFGITDTILYKLSD